MPRLVTITGPIAAGKSTVAALLADVLTGAGLTVVIADVDDVAAMVAAPGAAACGLWFAAHEAHGALVARWLLTDVDLVVSVGPVYSESEQEALSGPLPSDVQVLGVVVDAPLATTWERVSDDERRGLSRDRDFHVAAHERFRSLLPGIPADLVFDSGTTGAGDIAAAIAHCLGTVG
jgi:adenylylsulfate kinase-like enzyme